MSIPLVAEEIAKTCLYTPGTGLKIQLGQTAYRIELISPWSIQPGQRVLEIGCGQGDATTVIATAVGPTGHVIALDPAPLDYGSPFTLGQAQSHISSGPLGDRITFVQADPLDYVSSLPQSSSLAFDLIVFVQSTWYFSTPTLLAETIRALTPHTSRLAIAEFALTSDLPEAQPHILAALTQAVLEVHKPTSTSNVRTVLSPRAIQDIVYEVGGWKVEEGSEFYVQPKEDMHEGIWETGSVISEERVTEIEEVLGSDKLREKSMIHALRDATVEATKKIGGLKNVRTMSVWSATFSKA